MSTSFSNNFDNKEDSPLLNALSRHIEEFYYLGCNCAGKAPTMPVYRDEHLDDCPLRYAVGSGNNTKKI